MVRPKVNVQRNASNGTLPMSDDTPLRSWSEQAESAIQSGQTEKVTAFLKQLPPVAGWDFVKLLELCKDAADLDPSSRQSIQQLVLKQLDTGALGAARSRGDPPTPSLDPDHQETPSEDDSPSQETRVSLADTFYVSLSRAYEDGYRSPGIPELIFEHNRSALLKCHGLWICANYNRFDFLKDLLTRLDAEVPYLEARKNLLYKRFSGSTALAIAVQKGNSECVKLFGDYKIEPHMFEDPRACASDVPVLQLALQRALVESAFGQTQNAVSVIRVIIETWPSTLLLHNTNGTPPYRFFEEQCRQSAWISAGNQRILDLMRHTIFDNLEDEDAVGEALYGVCS
jgi:hypothetical protein